MSVCHVAECMVGKTVGCSCIVAIWRSGLSWSGFCVGHAVCVAALSDKLSYARNSFDASQLEWRESLTEAQEVGIGLECDVELVCSWESGGLPVSVVH